MTRQEAHRRRTGRIPKQATPDRLEKAAYHYVERYATSSENLRRVLMRRVDRSAHFHETDRNTGAVWVDEIVNKLVAAGVLDDENYAKMRAESLVRRGYGPKRIANALRAKGVPDDIAKAALAHLEQIVADPEMTAAIAFARRRRIGPFRGEDRTENRQRELAALARAGISYDVAWRIVEANNLTALTDEFEI